MESLPAFLRIPAVMFGIGLVIFVHELGHFMAARACGVRVLTFSLGFGPKLFSWTKNGTEYQIAAFPMGGYVRMAGDEPREDGLPPLDDELPSKSVGQRFLIYSGGVIMNVVFALVVFPILFSVGVPFMRPVVGSLAPGGPGWHAELPKGHEIVAVNDVEVFDFGHVMNAVALGDSDNVRLLLRDPANGDETLYSLAAEQNEAVGFPMIGVGPGLLRSADGGVVISTLPGLAAETAGIGSDDRIVGLVGGTEGLDLARALELQMLRGEALHLLINGPKGERTVTVTPQADPELRDPRIGIHPPANLIKAVRKSELTRRAGIRVGDRLVSIDGTRVRISGDTTRLMHGKVGPFNLSVLRNGRLIEKTIELTSPDEAIRLADAWAIDVDRDSNVVGVFPDSPASIAGILAGDRILSIDGTDVASWDETAGGIQRARAADTPIAMRVERIALDGTPSYHEITISTEQRPVVDYGFSFKRDNYVFKTKSLWEAVRVGAVSSLRLFQDGWLTVKRMLTRQVSPKNMGGIIMISTVSYEIAGDGMAKLFFFLCLLSMNLAFLNVLPIPMLDGGHLFFLIIEKIKGSPVPDRIMGFSQMVGVVLILSLMVYVTYNDIIRVLGG